MKHAGFLIVFLSVFLACATASCVPEDTVAPGYRDRIVAAMDAMRPGDWVLYYINDQLQLRMQVLDRDGEGVEIEYQTYLEKGPRRDVTVHRFEFDRVRRNLRTGWDIYGKTKILKMESRPRQMKLEKSVVNAVAWTMQTPGATITQYISGEVALWGIAAQRRNGDTVLLARSWGRGGEKIYWPKDLMSLLPSPGNKNRLP